MSRLNPLVTLFLVSLGCDLLSSESSPADDGSTPAGTEGSSEKEASDSKAAAADNASDAKAPAAEKASPDAPAGDPPSGAETPSGAPSADSPDPAVDPAAAPPAETPTTPPAEALPTGAPTAETPTDKDTIATIEPNTVIGFQSTEAPVVWKQLDGNVFHDEKDPDRRVGFVAQGFEREGTTYHFAMWSFEDGTGTVHAALFSGNKGAWKNVWLQRELIEEDEPGEELNMPWLLPLGEEHFAIVHVPAKLGCGSDDCSPKDDFVDTLFLEITPTGPVELLSVNEPPCVPEAERHPVAPFQCLVSTTPNESTGVADLVLELTGGKRRERRFTYEDGRYVEAKAAGRAPAKPKRGPTARTIPAGPRPTGARPAGVRPTGARRK